jgi:hypothetical protein
MEQQVKLGWWAFSLAPSEIPQLCATICLCHQLIYFHIHQPTPVGPNSGTLRKLLFLKSHLGSLCFHFLCGEQEIFVCVFFFFISLHFSYFILLY